MEEVDAREEVLVGPGVLQHLADQRSDGRMDAPVADKTVHPIMLDDVEWTHFMTFPVVHKQGKLLTSRNYAVGVLYK